VNATTPSRSLHCAGDTRSDLAEHNRDYILVPRSAATADLPTQPEPAEPASLAPVIWAVGIASFGALAFGYHLGVVNGPLDAIAADLGFAGNTSLQGTVSAGLRYNCMSMCCIAPAYTLSGKVNEHSHSQHLVTLLLLRWPAPKQPSCCCCSRL
jgi:hypothetical protein